VRRTYEHGRGDAAAVSACEHRDGEAEGGSQEVVSEYAFIFFLSGATWRCSIARGISSLFEKYYYEDWSKDANLAEADDRSREVYGVGYAGYMAMAELLGCVARKRSRKGSSGNLSSIDDASGAGLEGDGQHQHFLADAIGGMESGRVWKGRQCQALFQGGPKAGETEGIRPERSTNRRHSIRSRCTLKPWCSYLLYIDPAAVIAKYGSSICARRESDAAVGATGFADAIGERGLLGAGEKGTGTSSGWGWAKRRRGCGASIWMRTGSLGISR
jgi:hypothetical protein